MNQRYYIGNPKTFLCVNIRKRSEATKQPFLYWIESRQFFPVSFVKNFIKLTGKHLCQSLFLNKAAGLNITLLKKRLWYRCFPVTFAKFLRTPFFIEHLGGCFCKRRSQFSQKAPSYRLDLVTSLLKKKNFTKDIRLTSWGWVRFSYDVLHTTVFIDFRYVLLQTKLECLIKL